MKITLEPSFAEKGYASVTLDTLCNDESTPEAVEACRAALIAYGHTPEVVNRLIKDNENP